MPIVDGVPDACSLLLPGAALSLQTSFPSADSSCGAGHTTSWGCNRHRKDKIPAFAFGAGELRGVAFRQHPTPADSSHCGRCGVPRASGGRALSHLHSPAPSRLSGHPSAPLLFFLGLSVRERTFGERVQRVPVPKAPTGQQALNVGQ